MGQNKLQDSCNAYKQALEISLLNNNFEESAELLYFLGNVLARSEEYNSALLCLEEAYKMYMKLFTKMSRYVAITLACMGEVSCFPQIISKTSVCQ